MKILLASLAVAAATALAFTLGSTPAQATASNPYAGHWCGTFEMTDPPDTGNVGTVELLISPSGAIKGSYFNTAVEIGGTMTGHIGNDGTMQLNPNIYGPGPGGKGGNGEHYAGQCFIDGDGDLVAPTTGTWHDAPTVVAVLSPCE